MLLVYLVQGIIIPINPAHLIRNIYSRPAPGPDYSHN